MHEGMQGQQQQHVAEGEDGVEGQDDGAPETRGAGREGRPVDGRALEQEPERQHGDGSRLQEVELRLARERLALDRGDSVSEEPKVDPLAGVEGAHRGRAEHCERLHQAERSAGVAERPAVRPEQQGKHQPHRYHPRVVQHG